MMAFLRDAALVVATALMVAATMAGLGGTEAWSTLRHGLQLGRVELIAPATSRAAPTCACSLRQVAGRGIATVDVLIATERT